MALRGLQHSLAAGPRPSEDTILMIAPDNAAFERAAPLIDQILATDQRVKLVLAVKKPAALQERFPAALVRKLRPIGGLFSQPVLTTLRVRSVLVLDDHLLQGVAARLVAGAKNRGVPVYGLDFKKLASKCLLLRPLSSTAVYFGEALTIEALAGCLIMSVGIERQPRWSLDKLAAALGPVITGQPVNTIVCSFFRKINNLKDLRHELGNPRTILCLGNGPTSVNSALHAIDYDCLFRVNHRWLGREHLSKPDMVFAGVKRSMRQLGKTLLGVATPRKQAALLACRLFEPWHGKCCYCVVQEIVPDMIIPFDAKLKPTTGAYMLAAAVALQPSRILVAGMDLFAHPQGAYPDGACVPNAYAASHDCDVDVAFIRACLLKYRGELTSFSPAFLNLASSLEGEAAFTLVDATDKAM